jgi:hypothetical protein
MLTPLFRGFRGFRGLFAVFLGGAGTHQPGTRSLLLKTSEISAEDFLSYYCRAACLRYNKGNDVIS